MVPSLYSRAHSQPLQLSTPQRTLLRDAIDALGEHVQLTQLDLHVGPGGLPRLLQQRLLQAREAALRGADKILHRRLTGADVGKHCFGRHAAVHAPHASRLIVLALDAREKITQRYLGRVSGGGLVFIHGCSQSQDGSRGL